MRSLMLPVIAALLLAPFAATAPALAAAESPRMSRGQDAPAPTDVGGAEQAFEPLRKQFEILMRSLRNKGGMSPQDRGTVESLRDRIAAFNAQHAAHGPGVAAELQLSMWLEDHDRVDALFEQLVQIHPDEVEYGMAWTRYVARQGDPQRVDETYERLFVLYPEEKQLRITRARQLKDFSRFERALQILDSVEFDPSEHGIAYAIKAECLFAEHRFHEALETLDLITEEAMVASRALTTQVEQLRPQIKEYIELWAKEQEIRSAEAAADDLPRVRLNTPRGPIVVELFENEAPNHVANFITLAESGFYDGTKFHRVEPESLIQGGDPNTKPGASGQPGQGGPGYRIAAEYTREDHRNHFNDTLAMARSAAPDSAGSQFYLTRRPMPNLNGSYTVFGRVLEGLDVVRTIEINDELESAEVLRKRDHDYTVTKVGQPADAGDAPPSTRPDPLDSQRRTRDRE